MKLGDWVEFDHIVDKKDGKPVRVQPFDRTRRGMVIGQGYVYDAKFTFNEPPMLTNRQSVYTIAVSLYRSYRVFPDDLRPAAEKPARKKKEAT